MTTTTVASVVDEDPFADAKVPSLSWKNAKIGDSVTGIVTRKPQMVQARDFDTGKPAFWPPSDGQAQGNPKMAAVVTMRRVDTEELVSVWAVKPSAMFTAIAEAQQTFGRRIEVGGTLTLTFSGEKPNAKNPKLNPQKLYTADYEGPAEQELDDPLGLDDM